MANAEGSDNMLNRVMPKDNIGLAALLRTKEAAWDNGEWSYEPKYTADNEYMDQILLWLPHTLSSISIMFGYFQIIANI